MSYPTQEEIYNENFPAEPKGKTTYEWWMEGKVGNFGSFQTALFYAYGAADSGNKARLDGAFPHWFTEKYSM